MPLATFPGRGLLGAGELQLFGGPDGAKRPVTRCRGTFLAPGPLGTRSGPDGSPLPKHRLHSFRHTQSMHMKRQGATDEEIATVLGNSPKVVRDRYSRAMATPRLRQVMQDADAARFDDIETVEPVLAAAAASGPAPTRYPHSASCQRVSSISGRASRLTPTCWRIGIPK